MKLCDVLLFLLLSCLVFYSKASINTSVFKVQSYYQNYTTPPNVYFLNVTIFGAAGGGSYYWNNFNSYVAGGDGAYVTGILPTTPGQFYRIIVGLGGFGTMRYLSTPPNGFDYQGCGGAPFDYSQPYSGGGGGRSSIQNFTAGSYKDICTAGGGGGAQNSITQGGRASWNGTSFAGRDVYKGTTAGDGGCNCNCFGGGSAGGGFFL